MPQQGALFMQSRQFNRRRFLKSAAVVAAAPYVITSSALGNADTPPASERITLGHIGVGNRGGMGQLFSHFQQCEGAQSVAIADVYEDRRDAYAEMIKGKAYRDFRDILARDDIDAVVIATPDHWHVTMAIAAARAKKDTYLEKPLGLCIEQDFTCRKAFAKSGRIFQYGTQQRDSTHMQLGCELIRSGKLGKIHTIEVAAPNGTTGGSTEVVPVPPNLDYDMWCGPAPLKPYTADRCHTPGTYCIYDYSIGYLAGWGAHPLDIMVWACNSDLAGPITVEGTGEVPTEGLYDTVCDWDVNFQFSDGVRMVFRQSGVDTPGADSTKFIGSEGWLDLRRHSIDGEPKSFLADIGPDDVSPDASPVHCQRFIDAVKSCKPPVSSIDDAVRSDIISHLGDIAVRTKRKIVWDPKKATIVGDAEAAKMMHRDMRAPWTL
jgi:glucose-fructose oxidoreductase